MGGNVEHPVTEEAKLKGVPKVYVIVAEPINVYDLGGESTCVADLKDYEHHQMKLFCFKFHYTAVQVKVHIDC